jgi:hypothetical protein
MGMQLSYPKAFSDAEWKKSEKQIKVSATGVGKTLRDLQKAVQAINSELAGGQDAKKLVLLFKAANVIAKKSYEAISDQWRQAAKGSAAEKYLVDFRFKMGRYQSELEAFDPADHRGMQWPVDRFNDRVK